MNLINAIAIAWAVLLTNGCALVDPINSANSVDESLTDAAFIANNYNAADDLVRQIKNNKAPPGSSLIITTLVNIDALESSSTLGRSVSEQITTRFFQLGYSMVEMKFRDTVYLKRNEGEFMLTREISKIAKTHNADAVVVGTYADAGPNIFINLKVIDPQTSAILATTDYSQRITRKMRAALDRHR